MLEECMDKGEVLICEAKDGTETDELLQAGTGRHKRSLQDAKKNSGPGR